MAKVKKQTASRPSEIGGGAIPRAANAVARQSKAARTYITKSEGRVEGGRKAAATRKDNEVRRLDAAYKSGKVKGYKAGVATGTTTGVGVSAGLGIASKKDKKNTQAKNKKK